MELKITLEKLLKIWNGLEQTKPVESVYEFYYGAARNLRSLEPERDSAMETVNKMLSETPDQDEAIRKVNEFLRNNKVTVKIYKIKKEYLPKKWNAGALEAIFDLIDWEDAVSEPAASMGEDPASPNTTKPN